MITLLGKTVAFRPILTDQNSDAPDALRAQPGLWVSLLVFGSSGA